MSSLFHAYVNRVLDRIWVALRDTKVLVREGAAEALGACLQITSSREKQMGIQGFENIYEEAEKGLKTSTVEWIHGSLLAIQELLQHSKTVSMGRYAKESHRLTQFIICSLCVLAFIELVILCFDYTSIGMPSSSGPLPIWCLF